MAALFGLLFVVTLIAFPILWWKKRKARLSEGKESDAYKKFSSIKRVTGIVCIVSLVLASALTPTPEKTASAPQPKQEEKAQPKQEDPTIHVQLDYKIEKLGEHKYKVSGTTNLPDGIELMLTLSNQYRIQAEMGIPADTPPEKMTDEQFKKLMDTGYRGSDKPAVVNGKFESTFTGDKLNPGEYELTFSTPMWKILKNEDVKKKLGENGKYLDGKGVVSESSGKRISLYETVNLQ